ncbi:MAG: glycosyltransferase family 4 protein [Nitrososphaeria archaeon]
MNYSEITSPGGVHKVIREIAKNLSIKGHEVIVLQANPLNLPEEEIYEGFKIIRVRSILGNRFYGLSLSLYFYLKNHLTELNPDIIHVHGYHTLFSHEAIFILKVMLNVQKPIVFSPHYGTHGSFVGEYLACVYKVIGRRCFQLSDRIICASQFEGKTVAKDFGISSQKIVIIPHGVNQIEIPNRLRNKNRDFISLLYAGYLLRKKGVQFILKALQQLKYTYQRRVILSIIGNGNYKKELIKLAKKLKIEDSIYWYPFLNTKELNEKIKGADIFLLLSESENYGIIVAEALALGIPCIVADTTALSEFTNEPGCFGVDYPPDPKEVAKLVLKIMDSNIKVGPFSKKIRVWDEVVSEYERVYVNLLKMKKGFK